MTFDPFGPPQVSPVPSPFGQFTSFATGGSANLINSSSGSSVVMSAGQVFWAQGWVPYTVTLTGLIATTGSVGGTDNWIAYLWNGQAGAPVASSALAGIAAPAANTKQKFPFTALVTIPGPGPFWAALQSNGLTARFLGFGNAVEGFGTGQQAGVFGTPPALAPGAGYNVNLGPFMTTY